MRARHSPRRVLTALLGPAVLSLVVSGMLPLAHSAPATSPASAPSGQRIPHLTIAIGSGVENLDLPHTATVRNVAVANLVTEELFRINPKTGDLLPGLVESWELSADGLTYTLRLRRGVKFHDGTPFNAESVKFNILRFIAPETRARFGWLLAEVKDVEAADEHTVRITLKQPYAPFLANLNYRTGMGSPTQMRRLGRDYARHPIGTGPFRFVEFKKDAHVRLEANRDYWGGRPTADRVTLLLVAEEATRVALLEAGQADIIVEFPPVDRQRLERDARFRVEMSPSTSVTVIDLNTQWGPLRDRRVRQALNHAVNRQEILTHVMLGAALEAKSVITPGVFGYAPQQGYAHDPNRARQLLVEAGQGNGFAFKVTYRPGRYLNDAQLLETVQGYLSRVGVKMELNPMEGAAYNKAIEAPFEQNRTQAALIGRGAGTLDGDLTISRFHSKRWPPATTFVTFYKNGRVDSLIEEQGRVRDPRRRFAILAEIQRLLMWDAVWIYLVNPSHLVAAKRQIQGFEMFPNEKFLLHQVTLAR
ncbi:MAG: glutathione ABC transporter substrate-binding protein [Armatimonadetes bacterium]|nr:glutathione ABC transporter substrate-binding protein [Armatimonadota bacterium]